MPLVTAIQPTNVGPLFQKVIATLGDHRNPGNTLAVDNSTLALTTIEYEHHEIHAGSTYHVSSAMESLGNDASIIFLFQTSTPKEAHLIFEGSTGGNALLELCEGGSATGGTFAKSFNKNRVLNTRLSQVKVKYNPTVVALGTAVDRFLIPGGSGGGSTGGIAGQRSEWILDCNKIYLLKLTNIAGLAKAASLRAEWYEHTVKF